MDENIHYRDPSTRSDLVSYTGSTVEVRMNNNNNTLGSPQSYNVGFAISSIAVGDFDNNNFNDIIVGGGSGTVMIFRNINGTINWTSPLWTVSLSLSSPIVLVGDMGTPTDPNRNDGWVDVVVSGYEAPVKVFANTQGTFSSTPQQSFQSGLPYSVVGKMMLADIQNTGGLSFVYTHGSAPIGQPATMMIRAHKHTGNPAPAPPKGVSSSIVPGSFGYYYPKVSWAPNSERDIAGYDIYRKVTGVCGNGVWYYLASVNATTSEYTDGSIGTAGLGNDCRGYYKVQAKDTQAPNPAGYSDFSQEVYVDFSSLWFKRGAGEEPKPQFIPSAYALHAAYPNPFNPSTEIKFDLPEDGHVTLAVYDMLGRKVADLVNSNYAAGYHSAAWNANEIASGVYFARFAATDINGALKLSKVSKLILSK
jgi:hypothetical protein